MPKLDQWTIANSMVYYLVDSSSSNNSLGTRLRYFKEIITTMMANRMRAVVRGRLKKIKVPPWIETGVMTVPASDLK